MLVQDYRDPQKWGDPAFVAFVVAVCCLASCTSTTHEFVQAQMTGCRLGPCGLTFSIACAHFQEDIALPYTLFRPRWLRASMQSGGESHRKPSHLSPSLSHSRSMLGYTDPRMRTTFSMPSGLFDICG